MARVLVVDPGIWRRPQRRCGGAAMTGGNAPLAGMRGLPLLGRASERVALHELLNDARRGSGSALVIEGVAGVGKSRLLAEAAGAAEGMTVLAARGLEAEAVLPYAGLADLLAPLLHLLPRIPAARSAALRGALALDLPAGTERFATCAAVLSLLSQAADDHPLVLCIDDVQWLDPPSVEAVVFAARRVAGLAAAVLVTSRADEPAAPALDGLPRLVLGGLDEAAGVELIRRCTGRRTAASVGATLVRATGGNPLALTEVLDLLTDDQLAGRAPIDDPLPIGPAVERAMTRRLRILPASTRQALTVAAAAASADLAPVADAVRRLGGSGIADLEPAEDAGIVTIARAAVEFRHPLLRAAAYQDAPGSLRLAAHRVLAETASGERGADQRAWHLAAAAAGPDEAVAAALEVAATRARRGAGYAVATTTLARAAHLTPDHRRRTRRLLQAARDARLAGRLDQADQLLDQAAEGCDDAGTMLAIDHARGGIRVLAGDPLAGHALLTQAAERVVGSDPSRAAILLAEAAYAVTQCGMTSRAVALARRAASLLPVDGHPDARGQVNLSLAHLLALGGSVAEARPLFDALQPFLEAMDTAENTLALASTAHGRIWLEDYRQADDILARVITASRVRGSFAALSIALLARGDLQYRTGTWHAASADATEAVALASEAQEPVMVAFALLFRARVEAARGEADACHGTVATIRDLTATLPLGSLSGFYPADTLGFLELGTGHPDLAIDHLESVRVFSDAHGWNDPWVTPWLPDLVESYLRLGRLDEGRGLLDRLEELAVSGGRTWTAAVTRRYRGVLADTPAASDEAFVAAVVLHEQTPIPFERARTLLCWGERLRRDRRLADARDRLRQALDTFDRLGARPWAQRAATELAGTGARGHRPAEYGSAGMPSAGLAALTPQETQVALHVAQGLSNPEVAAALFLTRKTVEFHLGNVYRKLGVRTRSQLTHSLSGAAPPA
ncbi:LuxR family transcriptional regulator [Frankia sp. Cppng1_Ct_nod]|uniref:helix-turn-helix transcriptional regulator n=1 Tax=Frankia sp. Cppng1_Ct_nod TaxID=2897162 RepID=UPI0020240364|nr:LuxR family transcriptional regulator [Frankia sp. Cppng1_Ct_nod]